jgi:hypothetical protein
MSRSRVELSITHIVTAKLIHSAFLGVIEKMSLMFDHDLKNVWGRIEHASCCRRIEEKRAMRWRLGSRGLTPTLRRGRCCTYFVNITETRNEMPGGFIT